MYPITTQTVGENIGEFYLFLLRKQESTASRPDRSTTAQQDRNKVFKESNQGVTQWS